MRSTARLTRLLVTAGACWLACYVVASAQNQPAGSNRDPGSSGRTTTAAAHTIRGKVFLPNGSIPDQRIRVVLELSTGGIAQEVFSDSIGNFEFRSMPSNSYKVVVPSDHQNFETASEIVEVYGNFSRTFLVQVYLKEKGEDLRLKPKGRMLTVADMQEVPKAAKKYYEQGLKRVRDKKPEEAIQQFEEALKNFPDYLLAINKLGEQYLTLERPVDAQTTFERAIAVNSKYPLARINLGMLFVKQKRFPEAIEQLEAAIRLDDSFPMAHLNLGLALMDNDRPDIDRAEKELALALETGGKEFSYVRLYLFNLNLRRKNLDKAAEQLEGFLKETPEAPNAPQVRERLTQLKKSISEQPKKPR